MNKPILPVKLSMWTIREALEERDIVLPWKCQIFEWDLYNKNTWIDIYDNDHHVTCIDKKEVFKTRKEALAAYASLLRMKIKYMENELKEVEKELGA